MGGHKHTENFTVYKVFTGIWLHRSDYKHYVLMTKTGEPEGMAAMASLRKVRGHDEQKLAPSLPSKNHRY